jgi:hypothetical protein
MYNRQPRVLTEETGFSGGMLWTGNNIDATRLKTIVNLDYDETTGFLKTRKTYTPTPLLDADNNIINLDVNAGTVFIGAYNISATQFHKLYETHTYEAYLRAPFVSTIGTRFDTLYSDKFYNTPIIKTHLQDGDIFVVTEHYPIFIFKYIKDVNKFELIEEQTPEAYKQSDYFKEVIEYVGDSPTGQLYLFGTVSKEHTSGMVQCTKIQGVFKTNTGLCFNVTCDELVKNIPSQSVPNIPTQYVSDVLWQYNSLKPILLDNTLYFLNNKSDQIYTAYRLKFVYDQEPNSSVAPIYADLITQPAYTEDDWVGFKEQIDSVTLLEAGKKGFNGARGKDAYTFASREQHINTYGWLEGVYLTEPDVSKNPIVSPRVGQLIRINVIINGIKECIENKYRLCVYRLKPNGNPNDNEAWESISQKTITDYNNFVDTTFIDTTVTYAINLVPAGDELHSFYGDDVIEFLQQTYISDQTTLNQKTQTYDLTTAKSMTMWNKRMLLWDCENYNNALFLSRIGEFYYFPIPYNVLLFDTNVISCIPYLDSLLVFTASKLYKVSEDGEGNFIQEIIQNDMPLTREDAPYVTAIKNMVLFKSGKYFYMVVPKSQSLTGELTIAPIYKNIASLLNDLKTGVCEILTLLYPERAGADLADCLTISDNPSNVYVEQDNIHLLYDINIVRENPTTYDASKSYTFVLFLNYNTNLRAWTVYIEDTTQYSLTPTLSAASREMSFIRCDGLSVFETNDTPSESHPAAFRILLDTGYRTLSNSIKKRFREVQIKLYCESENITAFGSSFLVDGVCRKNYAKLKETYLNDNTVTLAPSFDLNTFIIEPSMSIDVYGYPVHLSNHSQQTQPPQGSNAVVLDNWKLDFSHFKREAPTTVRVPVSGKGYAPRFILMIPENDTLNINEINWVYRNMYGR